MSCDPDDDLENVDPLDLASLALGLALAATLIALAALVIGIIGL